MPSGVNPDQLNTPSLSGDNIDEWNKFDQANGYHNSKNNQTNQNQTQPPQDDNAESNTANSPNISNVGESSYANISGGSNSKGISNSNVSGKDKSEIDTNSDSNPNPNPDSNNIGNDNSGVNQKAESDSMKKDSVPASNVPSNYPSPENNGKYPRMGTFSERFFAFLIDGLIVGFIGGFLVSIIVGAVTALFTSMGYSLISDTPLLMPISTIIQWILAVSVTILYYTHYYTKDGQSPGKKILKLKVISTKEDRYLNGKETIIRETIGKYISGTLFSLGYLWYFMSPKRQAWHDSMVKSIVVKTNDSGEVFMDGLAGYKKEPLKTFLPAFLFFIVFTLIIGSYISLVLGTYSGLGNMYNNIDQYDSFDYEEFYDDPETKQPQEVDEITVDEEVMNSNQESEEIITNDPSYSPPSKSYDDDLTDGISNTDGVVSNIINTISKKDDANDTKRMNDSSTILFALDMYVLDNMGELPPSLIADGLYYQIGSCITGGSNLCPFAEDECVNLRLDITPKFIAEMPLDPTEGTPKTTGYAIMIDKEAEIVSVRACKSESGEIIESIK